MTDTHVYEVAFDADVNRRVGIDTIKRMKPAWIRAWLQWTVVLAVMSGFGLYSGTFLRKSEDVPTIVFLALTVGAIVAFGFMWDTATKAIAQSNKVNTGKRWTCTLTPDHWITTDQDGLSQSIPWKIMKISVETDDAFIVDYGHAKICILRGPLKAANLEQEFRDRIAAAQQTQPQTSP